MSGGWGCTVSNRLEQLGSRPCGGGDTWRNMLDAAAGSHQRTHAATLAHAMFLSPHPLPHADPISAAICESMQGLARQVWHDLERGHRLGMAFGEETLTDIVCLELAERHPAHIRIRKFTRREEGANGADWEWWLADQHGWFGLRVQAKVLNPSTLRYGHLRYRLRHQRGRPYQVTRLIQKAAKAGCLPVYVMYNWWDLAVQGSGPVWRCGSVPATWTSFGCSFASAHTLDKLIRRGQDDLGSVGQVSLPWWCLLCCPAFRVDLAGRARSAAINLFGLKEHDVPKVVDQPPDYIDRLLRGSSPDDEEASSAPELAGVMVIDGRQQRD